MGFILAPIVEGQLDNWKNWNAELNGPRRSEFEDLNKRYELTMHEAWHAETPMGHFACVLHDGPGGEAFMQTFSQSDHPFDMWMKEAIERHHDMDFSKPPEGPMPEKMISAMSPVPA